MFVKTKCMRLVWLLVAVGVANGIAEAAEQGTSCERPAPVANADLKPEYDSQIEFDHGAEVEYSCRIGYSIEGKSRKRKCENGQWSNTLFVCYEITCTYVDPPEHGKRLDVRNRVGEKTYFECDIGYKLTGPEKLLCRANGEWRPPNPPTCEAILCPELPSIRYGRTFQDSSDGMRNDYQSVTKYTCNLGYMLEGNNGQDTRECQADGTWSGEEPICTTPKCKHLGPFYGGDVRYYGERKQWTFAFYRCNKGYHMSPSNVKKSECTGELEWDPTPPQCFKTANVYIPENGYSTGNKDTLLHRESYTLRCKNDYEFYSEESGYIQWGLVNIRNNNGSLEPQVPKCLEKRCDATNQYKAIVKYTNGSRETSKILSQTEVILECKQGYDYYEGNTPMETPVRRKCVKGSIENAPVCEEARCLLSGYPDNDQTYHYRSRYRLTKGHYMRPGNELEVICTNRDDYELFVNSTGKYLRSFTSECRYGRFDKEVAEFPICLEKRCDANDYYKAIVKYTNGARVTSKISSQTNVRLECESGYGYYIDNQPMETVIRTCVKGHIVSAPVCEEVRCLVSGHQRNNDTYYRNFRTYDQIREGQYLEANNVLEVVCTNENEYELFVKSTGTYLKSFTSKCRYGRFDNEAEEFPICIEKRCHFEPTQSVCFKTNEKEECIRDEFKVSSRTFVTIKCREGYKLHQSKDGLSEYIEDEEHVTCLKGSYFQGYKCIPKSIVQAIKGYVKEAKRSFEKTLDRFTCRFSLFGSNPCEDPCLVPDIKNGFAEGKFDDKVNGEVTHGTKISVECNQGYEISEQVTPTCKFGEWDIDPFPFCSPRPCTLTLEPGILLWQNSVLLKEDGEKKKTFFNGTKIEIECANGFEMKNSLKERKLNNVRKEIVCVLGEWSHTYVCKAEQCSVPQVKNAVLKSKAVAKYNHLDKIVFRCDTGYHFNEENPKYIKRQFKTKCIFGNWSRSIPAKCRPDSCQLVNKEGSRYYNNTDLIEPTRRFPHGTQVGFQCLDNFDTFDENGNIVDMRPNITCNKGNWKDMHTCRKRCETLNVTNLEYINKVENISTDQDVLHGKSIMVRCTEYQDIEFQIECDNGEWKGYVDCSEKGKITNAGNSSENVDGCFLPSDKKFSYIDDNDIGVSEGSFVESGTTLTVRCAHLDYYELITAFDYYDNDTAETTVTCTGEELSHFDLDCPDVEPDSCMELHNGIVTKSFEKYVVSCKDGFSLNLVDPEYSECTCQNGQLKSKIGNQDPQCIPKNCVLPYDMDDKLSVKDRSRVISLSPGSTVTSGDHVYFNCSKVSEYIYEPLNRRFKCEKGQWKEDEKDQDWVFGNYGTFPKCREAICEPNCTNGGVCYKDDHCECKRLTEGKRCEIVRCDDKCIENGGKCEAAGKCVCPKGRYGPTCENKSCRLPENSAKPKEPKIIYKIGDTLKDFECNYGYMVSSKHGMTCQEDGSWSSSVQCVQSVFYLIRVKTGDAGLTGGAGTNANVYIVLHGQGGQTNKINLRGSFERKDLDETRVEEKDIRPITRVTIGHDGSGIGPDWLIDFVSIYVESLDEYYVFRLNDPIWIKEDKVGVLPLKDDCVNTFDSGHDWYPRWSDLEKLRYLMYYIGKDHGMTRRACQQKCTELKDFQCRYVHYVRLQKTCWGFSTVNERYYTTHTGNWDSVVYIRTCKKIFG